MSDELPKWFKIGLLINGIVCIIYGGLYVFAPEYSIIEADWIYYDPFFIQTKGITVMAFGIFSLYSLKVNDWEKLKIYFEFGILWLTLMSLLYIYGVATLPLTEVSTTSMITDIVVYLIFDAIYIIIYIQKMNE